MSKRQQSDQPEERRFPLRPLMSYLGLTEVTTFADRIGLSRRTCYRLFSSGVPAFTADRLAIGVGAHPLEIWPDFHDGIDWQEAA